MTQRQITLINNSSAPTSLAVLQNTNSGGGVVAWLAKYVYPNAQVRFTWDDSSLCFVWAGTGQISPGVAVDASQIVAANVNDANLISLSYDAKNRTFFFHDQSGNGQAGTLTIRTDTSIPTDAIATGIGMSDKPTLVMQAQPNMNYQFSPRPSYALAFGAITQGTIVDLHAITPQPVEFPPNVVALTATLGADHQWTVVSDILTTVTVDE